MHLVSEKNLNKFAYPVFPIKGRNIAHPYTAGEGKFICTAGYMKPENWMIMDIFGTCLIQHIYKTPGDKINFGKKIPTMAKPEVHKMSQSGLNKEMLHRMREASLQTKDGLIDLEYYNSLPIRTCESSGFQIRPIMDISITDAYLKKHLHFLKKYSSSKLHDIIQDTYNCKVEMRYPIRYYDREEYCDIEFNNFGHPSSFFTFNVHNSKISSDGNILERQYHIKFKTYLGYFFTQNAVGSLWTDLIPDKFYGMSDYAQLYYRLLILPFYGKVKNPIRMDEIRQRLDLKTTDTSMLRKTIKRILDELEAESFIRNPQEIVKYGPYMYGYEKTPWKEIEK